MGSKFPNADLDIRSFENLFDSECRKGDQMSTPFPKFLDELLANPPTAGTGVHNWLFKVSRQLHAHMGMVEMENFLQKKVKGCGRYVPIREIRDAIQHSASCAWTPGGKTEQSYFGPHHSQKDSKPALEVIDRIVHEGAGVYDLWEQSPHRFGDADGPPQTEMLIDALFPGDPLLCVAESNSEFSTRRRNVWRGHLSRLPLIVPNPMTKIVGKTKDGRISEHTLDATGPTVWLVPEFDFIPFARDGTTPCIWKPYIERWEEAGISILDACSALLWTLGSLAPLVLVVFSGGKSLHGWFRVRGSSEQQFKEFTQMALRLGACSSTINNRSQFVRMPDGLRNGYIRQLAWYFNPGLL
jgi:hypothetical protein